jgi:hypothetical protein
MEKNAGLIMGVSILPHPVPVRSDPFRRRTTAV